MEGFRRVKQILVPRALITQVTEFLRTVGRYGCEGLVLWLGTVNGETARLTESLVPKQTPLHSADGIGLYVGADTLHDLNVYLYQSGLDLIAQVHSHGEHAYHSDTDDSYSVVTTVGGLSIVVPDFAAAPFSLNRCAVLRLTHSGWVRLGDDEVSDLIRIED